MQVINHNMNIDSCLLNPILELPSLPPPTPTPIKMLLSHLIS